MATWKKLFVALFLATCITNVTFAEESNATSEAKADEEIQATSELKADEIEYDMETQQAKAKGNVNISHKPEEKPEESHLEADEVEYNMDTKQARAVGNVFIQHQDEPGKEPSQLNADVVEYDLNSGIMTAAGNVLLRQGAARATGKRAMYNSNTQEAYLLDEVIAVRDNVRITCDKLLSDGTGHMQADGNVYGVQTIAADERYPNGDTRTFIGDHIDYYPNDRKHIVIPAGGLITSGDGDFTADFMEGWLDEEYYFGLGNAHAISPPREMEAGGDRIEYFAKDGGKAILTGNAWAIQENNTIKGNRLTVYLADDRNLTVKPSNTTSKLTAPKIEEFEVFEKENRSIKNNNSTEAVDEKAVNEKTVDEKIFTEVEEDKKTGGNKE